MKKSDILKQERYQLMTDLKELPNSGLEKRAMEQKENELTDKIHDLSGQILEVEREEKEKVERAMRSGTRITNSANDLDRYSFTRAIRVAMGIETGGIESEMAAEARREMSNMGQSLRGFGIPSMVLNRASSGQNYTTPGDGGYLVGPGGMKFYEALRNRLTLSKLGATFLTGLSGTLPLVQGGTFSAAWAEEGQEVSKTKTSFTDRGTLKPRRLGSLGALSKELIFQSSPDVEQIIINELADSIAQAIETAAINGSGQGAEPVGILNYVGIGAVVGGENGAAITWDKVVELETTVNSANGQGQKMGYLTNSKVIGKLKTTVKGSADEFIMNGPTLNVQTLNGYTCAESNAVPSDLDKGTSTGVCSALIFGDFSSLVIGQWGGLDLLIDPYTLKAQGDLDIMVNQFMDLALSRPAKFAAIKDVLTS